MKRFLLKITLFLVLFVVTFALPIVIETVVRSRVSLEIPQDETILFIGDSQIECGVNDRLIPCSFNWAKSAENYLNLYVRTRKLLEANPQISTVFITTTPYSLREHADWNVFRGDAGVLLQPNIIFYEREDLGACGRAIANALKNPGPHRKALFEAIRTKTFGTLKEFGGFKDLGDSQEGFWKDIANDCKYGKKRLSRGRHDEGFGSELSVKYLQKTVEFVRARGVRIIFLNPPVYHEKEFLDVPYYEAVLKEKFPDVEFWDYGDFPMPENCFANINHLNGKGAEIFSKELVRRMRDEGIIESEQ